MKNVYTSYYKPSQMLAPESNVILACHIIKSDMESCVKLNWIKGHQYNGNQFEDLPPEVQLNMEMNHGSKAREEFSSTIVVVATKTTKIVNRCYSFS